MTDETQDRSGERPRLHIGGLLVTAAAVAAVSYWTSGAWPTGNGGLVAGLFLLVGVLLIGASLRDRFATRKDRDPAASATGE